MLLVNEVLNQFLQMATPKFAQIWIFSTKQFFILWQNDFKLVAKESVDSNKFKDNQSIPG